MEKRKHPDRSAWVIVGIVHIGIVMLWFSMGGCGTAPREHDSMPVPESDQVESLQIEKDYEVMEDEVTIEDRPRVIIDDSGTATRHIETANEVRYVVQPGDSLWKISRTFGVTVEAIMDRNDIQDAALIRVGRELWIPNPTKGLDQATTPTTEPTVVEPPVTEPITEPITEPTTESVTIIDGATTSGEITPPTESTTGNETISPNTIETFEYEVQPGDTIWKLARTYHTTSETIMQLNNITDPKKLRAGDKILIPKPVQ